MVKILIVDDDTNYVSLQKRYFTTSGFEVHEATTFEEAIAKLKGKIFFDLIVFDLYLTRFPLEDPYFWLNALITGLSSNRTRVPPIIIVTGYSLSKEQIIRGFTEFNGQLVGFFEKDHFDLKEFASIIRRALETKELYQSSTKRIFHTLVFTILMLIIVSFILVILAWTVNKFPDAQTRQTFLQVGGGLIIVVAIFIVMFTQNSKLEGVINSILKFGKSP